MHLIKDLLFTDDPQKTGEDVSLSQARLYLLITFLVTISIIVYAVIRNEPVGNMDTLLDSLFAVMVLFAAYAFGAKGLKTLDLIKRK